MKDGIINPSKNNPFGFTAELFDGYLCKLGDDIFISLIESREPRKGNFRRLCESIMSQGFILKIPTPLGRMQEIVEKNGYTHTLEFSVGMQSDVDVWVKKK